MDLLRIDQRAEEDIRVYHEAKRWISEVNQEICREVMPAMLAIKYDHVYKTYRDIGERYGFLARSTK